MHSTVFLHFSGPQETRSLFIPFAEFELFQISVICILSWAITLIMFGTELLEILAHSTMETFYSGLSNILCYLHHSVCIVGPYHILLLQ